MPTHYGASADSRCLPGLTLPAVLPSLAVVVALLAGCASPPGALPQRATPAPAVAATVASAAAADVAGVDALPQVYLSNDILFRILVAEIALQRGEPATAYSELLSVARKTRDPRLARRAAEVAIDSHALKQALDAAELWHELAPHDPEVDLSYSSLLVANGSYEQARPMLAHQIAASSNPIEVLDRLQRLLARAPASVAGYLLLEALARPYLDRPDTGGDVQLILARGAHAAGNKGAALAHARAAVAARPDSDSAVMTLAELLAESDAAGDPQAAAAGPGTDLAKGARTAGPAEAIAMLARFVLAQPDALEVRLLYARLLVGAGRLADGRLQFEELLRRAPQNPDPLFALGVLALEAERYAQARDYLQRYLDAVAGRGDRDLDQVYLDLARVAEGQRQYDEARAWLHKVKGSEQRDAALEQEAFLLGRMNRVDDGLRMLQQITATTPERHTLNILAQGQLLRDARRYADSYRLLDQALQQSPDDTGLLYESAMSAERLDRIDLMETRLRHLLALHPDYAHAYNALGYSLADRNIRLPEAYQLINQALALAPDDGFIVDSLGWVQYRMGDLTAAREALRRAFELKADPDVAAHLGEVLWASGDHSAARELLLEAQGRDGGDSDTLRDTLLRLKIQP